ncbi:hypothetical protein NDU88_008012 [Pleurodeles waltl]|uniref:Uncharacterized protein n=1 Tax=Pleurodeles waltl TaxID=8319 RepID=A0AAV7QPK5_PLEWA|nr:hypothetical protein NDU88_008012 [Pleurodeles waltl]
MRTCRVTSALSQAHQRLHKSAKHNKEKRLHSSRQETRNLQGPTKVKMIQALDTHKQGALQTGKDARVKAYSLKSKLKTDITGCFAHDFKFDFKLESSIPTHISPAQKRKVGSSGSDTGPPSFINDESIAPNLINFPTSKGK